MNEIGSIVEKAIVRLLKPLVRILLKQGIPHASFSEMAKKAYVEVARDEFTIEGRKQSASRISVLTGLNRKDVARLTKDEKYTPPGFKKKFNRASRVIRGWTKDPDFTDKFGNPLPLSFEGEPPSFKELVKEHSGDMPPRAILDELIRIGTVIECETGLVELVQQSFVPENEVGDKYEFMGISTADLLETIAYNLDCQNKKETRFQRFVSYDYILEKSLPQIRAMSRSQCQAFLEQANAWLSNYDVDANEDLADQGDDKRVRAGIGLYYFESAYKEDEE